MYKFFNAVNNVNVHRIVHYYIIFSYITLRL